MHHSRVRVSGTVSGAWFAAALASVGCTRSYEMSTPRVPLAPAGVLVDWDVARGYFSYRDALARWGTWVGDDVYGVRWCPSADVADAAFRPYASRGHWAASSEPRYGAPPETPYWASEDGAWGEITMHHGWWIVVDRPPEGHTVWCWVPGVQETPASVVWRSGGEFVGWAPESPFWVDDGDDNESAGFEWNYELLGTLLDDAIEDLLLRGDDEAVAADATEPSRQIRGLAPPFDRRGPARPVVVEARQHFAAQWHPLPHEALTIAGGRAYPPSDTTGGRRPLEARDAPIGEWKPQSTPQRSRLPPVQAIGARGSRVAGSDARSSVGRVESTHVSAGVAGHSSSWGHSSSKATVSTSETSHSKK